MTSEVGIGRLCDFFAIGCVMDVQSVCETATVLEERRILGDLRDIYKARRDPALALRLGARLAREQALERLAAPLFVVHFGLWAVMVVCALLSALALFGAASLHWTVALPALLPAGIGYLAWRLNRGLGAGEDLVRRAAEDLSEAGMDRLEALAPSPAGKT